MSDNILCIQAELESLGYKIFLHDGPHGEVVAFEYKIEVGPHAGKMVTLGISMQGNEAYPEYPPHWIHVAPEFNDGKGGAVEVYSDKDGKQWISMSRAPGTLWDELSTKHMTYYLNEHLRRFWNNM